MTSLKRKKHLMGGLAGISILLLQSEVFFPALDGIKQVLIKLPIAIIMYFYMYRLTKVIYSPLNQHKKIVSIRSFFKTKRMNVDEINSIEIFKPLEQVSARSTDVHIIVKLNGKDGQFLYSESIPGIAFSSIRETLHEIISLNDSIQTDRSTKEFLQFGYIESLPTKTNVNSKIHKLQNLLLVSRIFFIVLLFLLVSLKIIKVYG